MTNEIQALLTLPSPLFDIGWWLGIRLNDPGGLGVWRMEYGEWSMVYDVCCM